MLAPFLVVPLPSLPPDLVGWHDGVALHMSTSMVKLRSLVTDSLHQRIRNPQGGSDGGVAGEVPAWCFWCLCVGSWSGGGGSLSLPPLFCETVGFFLRISHGDSNKVFRSSTI
jgi:hypothetical protein